MTSRAVITLTHDRDAHLENHRQEVLHQLGDDDIHVTVHMGGEQPRPASDPRSLAITDPDHDPVLNLSRARNLGAGRALRAGATILVFLDVDCVPDQGLVEAYADLAVSERRAIWSGPVTYLPPPPPGGYEWTRHRARAPHPARPFPDPGCIAFDSEPGRFWSLSFACHAAAWIRTGGFCERYRGYGGEDTDFAVMAQQRGVRLGYTGDAHAWHQWHASADPPVQHLRSIVNNAELFHSRWGWWPMKGWLESFEQAGLIRRTPRGIHLTGG